MSYIKQNFTSGGILYADQLNSMDNEIKNISDQVLSWKEKYVTPEMFGAIGDGVHDDALAIQTALESDKPVKLTQDLYIFSHIRVANHNVDFDGCGYTIYVDYSNIYQSLTESQIAIQICATEDENATDLKVIYNTNRLSVWEYWYPDADSSHNTDIYGYGYLSYRNENPAPQWLIDKIGDNPTIKCFNQYSAHIRNLNIYGINMIGHYCLSLRYMCHSNLNNINVSCDFEHDGKVGIWISRCYDVIVEHCYAENFASSKDWDKLGNNGYGLQCTGDKITVRDYIGYNNESNFNLAGDRYIWTTRFIMDGANMSYDASIGNNRPGWDGNKTSERFATIFNSHADAICPIFNNIHVAAYNHKNRELIGFRCPECIVNNLTVHTTNGGIMLFSEFPEHVYISGLYAPTLSFRCYGGGNWAVNPKQKDIILINSYIKEVERFNGSVTLRMSNCIVQDKIWNVSHLVMDNCKVLGDRDWLAMQTIIVLEDAIISNSEIWANRSKYTSVDLPVIDAPEDSIQMCNCLIKILPEHNIFSSNQKMVNNIKTEHRFGLILNSDYSMLNEFYPYEEVI